MGGNLHRRSVTGSLILASAALVLSACGGGHEEDEPLTPSYVGSYRVSLNLVFNTCGGSPAAVLSQIHRISQTDRNVLVERDNVAYQGNVEIDNKGFVAFTLAEGRPVPEGRLYYRHTADPGLFTAEQTEFLRNSRGGTCQVTYRGTAVKV